MKPKGTLYLVPTPIGNLGDITLRALETLKSVKMIAAEDTRTAGKLLQHYGIRSPRLISYHKFSEQKKAAEILEVLAHGDDVAIISDAGSPGISDPSELIVKQAISQDFKVVSLPGATAFVPALTASGLPISGFRFLGFLPAKQAERKALLHGLRDARYTTVIYESPHRIHKTLGEMQAVLGNRKIVIAREISKIYEEYLRGSLDDFSPEGSITLKGEFVILLSPANDSPVVDTTALKHKIEELLNCGEKGSEIIRILSADYPRNEVYDLLITLKNQRGKQSDS